MMPLPRTGVPHLWIVLTDPHPATKKVVAVMVVTERAWTDKTVTLNVGDHQFIAHASNIDFGGANTYDVDRLHAAIIADNTALRENLRPRLLESVRAGLHSSTRTSEWMKEYCSAHFDARGQPVPTRDEKKS